MARFSFIGHFILCLVIFYLAPAVGEAAVLLCVTVKEKLRKERKKKKTGGGWEGHELRFLFSFFR